MADDVVVSNIVWTGQVLINKFASHHRYTIPCCGSVVTEPDRMDERFKHVLCACGTYRWRGRLVVSGVSDG